MFFSGKGHFGRHIFKNSRLMRLQNCFKCTTLYHPIGEILIKMNVRPRCYQIVQGEEFFSKNLIFTDFGGCRLLVGLQNSLNQPRYFQKKINTLLNISTKVFPKKFKKKKNIKICMLTYEYSYNHFFVRRSDIYYS